MLYAEWFFIEGEKVRMPTERRTTGWHMYQGVVHTSLRLRSRIYNNSLGERLLFRAWNFPHSKQASSQQKCLWISEVIWFHESESKYTPVPGWGYAPAKIFGGAKLVSVHPPSIHYRENLDFSPAGIRVAITTPRATLVNPSYPSYTFVLPSNIPYTQLVCERTRVRKLS